MRKSIVVQKLKNNEPIVMISTSFTNSSKVTELTGMIGFDCIWIDMEHRTFDYKDVFQLIQGARVANTDCVVRIRKESYADYFRVLEDGAAGIMIPHCKSKADAEYAVKNCKYPPLGRRGIDGVGVDALYGLEGGEDYLKAANEQTFIVIQIEDAEALDKIEEIAAVKGIDIIFIGIADLSSSLGIPGKFGHPEMEKVIGKIATTVKKYNKHWGLPCGTPEIAKKYIEMGALFIHTGSDRGIIYNGLKKTYDDYRNICNGSCL